MKRLLPLLAISVLFAADTPKKAPANEPLVPPGVEADEHTLEVLKRILAVGPYEVPDLQLRRDTAYAKTPVDYEPYGKIKPYKEHFLEQMQYWGPGRAIPEPEDVKTVKIGFIGPIMSTVSVATGGASHEEPMGIKMLQGARLAIEEANARGGYLRRKIPFELVVTNDNGLWGSSGNEIVNFAYKDHVWAILGTIDSANSHIAIRVADIRRAEAFYHDFFGMDVIFRARQAGERWDFLPADFDWDAGLRQGIYPEYCYLRNGPLALLIQAAGRGTVFIEPRLQHISLRVAPESLVELRGVALARGYAVSEDQRHSFVFRDPFGEPAEIRMGESPFQHDGHIRVPVGDDHVGHADFPLFRHFARGFGTVEQPPVRVGFRIVNAPHVGVAAERPRLGRHAAVMVRAGRRRRRQHRR